MDIFGCSKPTAIKIKKSLIKVGLLEAKRRGQGKADLLYLKKPIVTDEDVYKIKKEEETVIEEEKLSGPELIDAQSRMALGRSKNLTSEREKNEPHQVKKFAPNDTDFNDTDFNDTDLNPKPNLNPKTAIYDLLWDTQIPSRLKIRIKILLQHQSINLSPEQILLIEDAYLYQIRKSYVVPDCAADDITALNDYEFSATVEKMLKTVKKIDNIRGLIKSWVKTAYDYKCCEQYVGDFSSNQTDPKLPFYDWLND
jgi:hypothetical protein